MWPSVNKWSSLFCNVFRLRAIGPLQFPFEQRVSTDSYFDPFKLFLFLNQRCISCKWHIVGSRFLNPVWWCLPFNRVLDDLQLMSLLIGSDLSLSSSLFSVLFVLWSLFPPFLPFSFDWVHFYGSYLLFGGLINSLFCYFNGCFRFLTYIIDLPRSAF